jgi:Flp pilus assembly protein protease CpaA
MLAALLALLPWLALLALPWLAFCAWHDLRTRTVPGLLTIPPLVFAIGWQVYLGVWPLAALAATLIFLDDLPWRWRGFLVGVQGLLLAATWHLSDMMTALLGLVLMFIWLLWKMGAIGGADAQVVMTLALFFGLSILVPVALATGVQALLQKFRGKDTIPAMLGIFAGVGIFAGAGIHTLK